MTFRRMGCARATIRPDFAGQKEVAVAVIFSLLPDQAKHATHDIANNKLPGLRSNESTSNKLHALNQFGSIGGAECRDHTREQVSRGNGGGS